MYCPKCGFEQAEAPDCLRCGLVFARYRKEVPAMRPMAKPTRGNSRKLWRTLRWTGLGLSLLAIILILRVPQKPFIVIPPDASQRAEEKIQNFQSSLAHHRPQKLVLDQSELNGWLEDSLARNKTSLHDVKMELLEDSLRLFVLTEVYGMDESLELEGRILIDSGYMRLLPVSGRLGSLPLPSGTLQKIADKIFLAPENREKFHLPPEVQDIRIDQGRLIVSSR